MFTRTLLIYCCVLGKLSHARSIRDGDDTTVGQQLKIEPVTEPLIHAEGPHWEPTRGLYFVDISAGALFNFKDCSALSRVTIPGNKPVSLVIPVHGHPSELILTRGREIIVFDERVSNVTKIVDTVEDNKPGNRFNDGKADPKGRLWVGTMGYEDIDTGVVPGQGSLYILGKKLEAKLYEVDISNGLAWNSNGTKMYYIDSPKRKIDVFDFNLNTGEISNRQTAFDFATHNVSGYPDGMTIDSDDLLWVACWGGYKVIKVDPVENELVYSIQLPVRDVAGITWGGTHLDELYVTTSRRDLRDHERAKQPLAGSVFKITGTGSHGVPASQVVLRGV